jgi:hypothetical protein
VAYKIHPGIGVARVGDSLTDWFVGPETRAEPEPPYGGYRDAEGRIKRQAARFRVFDHVAGTAVPVDGLLVTWTVLLGPDPLGPSVTLTGPNKVLKLAEVPFSGGPPAQVSWGEVRTDSQGNLLVLSGVPDGGFYATSCGRISASVTGNPALRSWVAILPPNFSPCVRPTITAYDYLIELAGVPSPLLFLRDIYPLLKVVGIGDANLPAGNAAEHAQALAVPTLAGNACNFSITTNAKAILTAWTAGPSNYTVEAWPPPPPSLDSPEELDRGPLSRVAFGGWDLGSGPATWLNTFTYLAASGDPLRLDLSAPDAYPANFKGMQGWRSDNCTAEWPQIWGTAGALSAFAPNPWQTRGFVVRQAGTPSYVEDILPANPISLVPYVMQLTRSLEFGDVRQSASQVETAAIIFEIGHQSGGVNFNLSLPAWLSGPSSYNVPVQAAGVITTERIPIGYAPTAVSEQNGVIQVQQVGGPLYSIPVHARTIAPVATEVVFVLDHSYSMTELCADNLQKIEKLRQALDTFIALTQPADGVGAVAFNQAVIDTLPVTAPDSSLHDFAALLSPAGSTSIGTGIEAALDVFSGAFSAQQALIVVTDGKENVHPFVNEVMDQIADPTRVFGVGIGRAQDVNTSVLQALCGNQGGYLLLTGSMSAATEALVLDKFFLRILANASNIDVILDPPTTLYPGKIERIPFPVSEFEHSFDAIVLSREREAVAFALEAPDGTLVTPETLEGWPGNRYATATNVAYYRVRLPLPLLNAPAVATGTWQLVLALRKPESRLLEGEFSQLSTRGRAFGKQSQRNPVACEVVVHTHSDLHLDATLQQSSIELGSAVLMELLLNVKGQPFVGNVSALAHVRGPTGFTFAVRLDAQGAGRFVGRFEPVRPGIYRVTMVCEGTTPRGHAFRREQLATAAVLDSKGGGRRHPDPCGEDDGPDSPNEAPNIDSECKPSCNSHLHRALGCALCKLLFCLRTQPGKASNPPRRCALCFVKRSLARSAGTKAANERRRSRRPAGTDTGKPPKV